jgi:acetyl-CoA carboxylase biotin carboxyl carrier protein
MSEPKDRHLVLNALREQTSELIDVVSGPLRRIRIRSGDTAIEVEWHSAAGAGRELPAATGAANAPAHQATDGPPAASHDGEDRRVIVTSPMVGTFYRAHEPGAKPLVAVGDVIEEGQVVGLIEAMKLMNPVTAVVSGQVVEILADNGQPVEFDQPLVAVTATH